MAERLRGQILDVEPATPDVMTRGDPDLAKARGAAFRSQVRETDQMVRELRTSATTLETSVEQGARKDGKRLTVNGGKRFR